MKGEVIRDLAAVINSHSFDSTLNMPDFIIAEMLYLFLVAIEEAQQKEKKWRLIK